MIKLQNKSKIESEMSNYYYQNERNKGIDYIFKDVIASIFCFCCKPKGIRDKEKILEDSENRLNDKLNASNIFKFSV